MKWDIRGVILLLIVLPVRDDCQPDMLQQKDDVAAEFTGLYRNNATNNYNKMNQRSGFEILQRVPDLETLPSLWSFTVLRKTSNRPTRSVGPALCSGWN